jgi:hypothetical protein
MAVGSTVMTVDQWIATITLIVLREFPLTQHSSDPMQANANMHQYP